MQRAVLHPHQKRRDIEVLVFEYVLRDCGAHDVSPGTMRGTLNCVPAGTSRGLSTSLSSAMSRHCEESPYSCQAMPARVCPGLRVLTFVRSPEWRGVCLSCSSIVLYSRKLTFIFARSGTPAGLNNMNSSLTLSRTQRDAS